jgi:hypothetical protein
MLPMGKKSAAQQLNLAGVTAAPTAAPLPRLAYTLQESAKILGISYISVYRLCSQKKLKCNKALPGRTLIAHRELESFLAKTSE